MKLPYKIALNIIGAVLLASFIFSIINSYFEWAVWVGYYGLVGCVTGVLCLLAAFITSIADKEKRAYVQGLLLGGGLVLLTGAFALVYIISNISFGR